MVIDCNTVIELSRPFDSNVCVMLRENGVANERNKSVQFRLIPTIPLDQDEVVLYENVSLTIVDLDSK